jgi:cytochrome c5
MKRVVLGWFGAAVMSGCTMQPALPPVPDMRMAESSGKSVETLQRGRAVYISDCTRCHEAMMPKDISQEDWHVILPGMAWNSGISGADEEAVEAYIQAVKSEKSGT